MKWSQSKPVFVKGVWWQSNPGQVGEKERPGLDRVPVAQGLFFIVDAQHRDGFHQLRDFHIVCGSEIGQKLFWV